jgi:hypothetical protein
MPSLAVTPDLAILDQLGHDAVKVIRLDLELLGDLWNRDPRFLLDERERLVGACVTTPAATRATGTATTVATTSCGRGSGGARRPTRTPTPTYQRGTSGLKLLNLNL